MIWTKYTIQTTTQDADMVSAILMDHEICDVQIENNVQLTDEELNQMYADFVKELPPDDGSCALSFYIESEENAEKENTEQMLKELQADLDDAVELFGIAPCQIVCEDLNSEDWENNWKEFFKPFMVDKILIAPTWEEIPEETGTLENKGGEGTKEAELVIRIDPGMAFGTGTHETTRLCLRALQRDLKPGMRVLDLGCGSGILGIAAVKLGASDVVSVDIDEQAVRVAVENFVVNQVPEDKARFETGNVVTDAALQEKLRKDGLFDVVTVNILADVIAEMMPALDQYLKDGGTLITSGILTEKEETVKAAAANNPRLSLKEVTQDGDWVSIVFTKQ